MKDIRNIGRRVVVFLLSVLQLCFFSNMYVLASDNITSTDDLSKAHEYFSRFYSDKYERKVLDECGLDVTDYFVEKTESFFNNNDIDSINQIIIDENLSVCIFEEHPMNTYALEQFKNFEYYNAEEFKSTDGKYTTIITFTFNGGFWYNPNTSEVTRTSGPKFNIIEVSPEYNTTVNINNISTGSYPANGKGLFWATFTINSGYYLEGAFIDDIDYPLGRIEYYATP